MSRIPLQGYKVQRTVFIWRSTHRNKDTVLEKCPRWYVSTFTHESELSVDLIPCPGTLFRRRHQRFFRQSLSVIALLALTEHDILVFEAQTHLNLRSTFEETSCHAFWTFTRRGTSIPHPDRASRCSKTHERTCHTRTRAFGAAK